MKVNQNNIHKVIGDLQFKFKLKAEPTKSYFFRIDDSEGIDDKKTLTETLNDLGLIKTAKFIKKIFKC
jgi:hypothetical protein